MGDTPGYHAEYKLYRRQVSDFRIKSCSSDQCRLVIESIQPCTSQVSTQFILHDVMNYITHIDIYIYTL